MVLAGLWTRIPAMLKSKRGNGAVRAHHGRQWSGAGGGGLGSGLEEGAIGEKDLSCTRKYCPFWGRSRALSWRGRGRGYDIQVCHEVGAVCGYRWRRSAGVV